MANRMTIGEAAAATGVSAKMIRYYESIGLFRPEARSATGYRLFSAADLHTLRFIRRARDLGFSIDEISELLALWRDRRRSSAEVKSLALAHLADLEQRIGELQGLADTLRHLARHCHGDARPDCPILGDLAGEQAPRRPA
jgi:MerR family transcriptional regulator, copper efflux regulator